MRKITDDTKEIFEIVDKKGQVIGKAQRNKCHQDENLIHQAVHLYIFNQKNQVLLQKRSATKDLYPGCFTASASGHLNISEGFKKAVLREAKEELSIDLKKKDLKAIGKFLIKAPTETELIMVFFTTFSGFLNPAKQEVEDLVWFDPDRLFDLIKNKEIKLTPSTYYFLTHKKIIKAIKDYFKQ
ncbi:MAG TPA: NUDIX domain-containing protein [Candidatus Bathyarchaeia archaeon]|nr:NUDIX domain-containing protein [Candidatus Bathyarchaeia archaeon]